MSRKFSLVLEHRPPGASEVTTQKAKGLCVLESLRHELFGGDLPARDFRVWPVNAQLGKIPAFARPCPVTPKHGFVESRPVKGWQEFEEIKQETLMHDSQAELILMPQLSGEFSGIMTPSAVSYGRGNDGATSGKSKVIPCPNHNFEHVISSSVQKAAKIKEGEVPYLELVEDQGKIKAVQLRSGPKQPTCKDFIPYKTKVEKILDAADYEADLIEFDRRLKYYAKKYPQKLVVYAEGASLASHFAVQSMILSVPCLTSRKPRIGETLAFEKGSEKQEWKDSDYQMLANAISRILGGDTGQRWAMAKDDEIGLCKLAVGGMHANLMWNPEPHLINLAAHGITACAIFTIAACLGETRHWYASGPGRGAACPCDCCDCEDECMAESNGEYYGGSPETRMCFKQGNPKERGEIYREALALPLSELLEQGERSARDLGADGWSGSFGGEPWQLGGEAAVKLLKQLCSFAMHPSPEAWQECQTQWNHTVNQNHNNGKILTKWIQSRVFDSAACSPSFTFISKASAHLTLDAPKPESKSDLFLMTNLKRHLRGIAA